MTLFPDVGGLSVPRAAQVYVEAGIPIAVFDPTRGNGKECGNLIGGGEGKWYEHVTADADVIRSWRAQFGRFTALATSPGAFGAVCIDVDSPAEFPLHWRSYLDDSSVPFVATRPKDSTRRGHYWFSLPAGVEPIGNRGFKWGDIRCMGGGVVLPPYGDRTVVRSGVLPTLPTELYVAIAGAVGGVEPVDLEEFFSRHVTQRWPHKLKALGGLFERNLSRTGSRHVAAREALKVGFGEARVGYVEARRVYESIRWRWDKSEREFVELARWCASVAMATDLDELKARSDRSSGTDSREYSSYFATRTG